MKPTAPFARQPQCVCHDTLDFIQVPGYPSAIRVLALTHSRRNVVQRLPWLISFSLDVKRTITEHICESDHILNDC
jgi:hypothetical protein